SSRQAPGGTAAWPAVAVHIHLHGRSDFRVESSAIRRHWCFGPGARCTPPRRSLGLSRRGVRHPAALLLWPAVVVHTTSTVARTLASSGDLVADATNEPVSESPLLTAFGVRGDRAVAACRERGVCGSQKSRGKAT